jgi:hypothetical protein
MADTRTDHPLADLMKQYTNAEGERLIQDSRDWKQINAAIEEWAQRVPIPDAVLKHIMPWLHMIGLVVKMAYILGYRRGKREASMPEFIVAGEVEE